MSSEDKKLKCASCGLVSTEATLRDHHGFRLCSLCTLDHTIEPNYEAIVYSVAVGYFINEKHIEDVGEALDRALEFVSQHSYWQDKELPLPTLTGLKNVQLAINLSSNMKTLEYDDNLLEYPDFFISHKWHKECDLELVEPLVASLRDRGFRIWYDKATWGEETGKTTDWMGRGIQNARYIVPILCKDYFHSDNCRFELKQILDKTEDHKKVFPIWWHDINPNFLKTQEYGKELLEIISITWDEVGGDIEELVSELVRRANATEGLREYNGVTLQENEVRFLEQLESLVHEPIPDHFFPHKSPEDFDPPEFGFYQENNMITGLFLKNKGLKGLSKAIGNLSNLKELDLSNNQLSSLPESLGSLSSLEMLNLDGNPLSENCPRAWRRWVETGEYEA
ncbi:MAG: TIR domain-containing protein, partial [Candidatus Hodarchaeota archaeon]